MFRVRFCPCFLFYLICTVPAIYILELDRLDRYNQIYLDQNQTASVALSSLQGVRKAALTRDDPLSYFSFQPVLHDWCNKGRGMCYPVSGMVHIKEPLLLIDQSSLCGSSGFPFSLSEWSLTICLTPYNRR